MPSVELVEVSLLESGEEVALNLTTGATQLANRRLNPIGEMHPSMPTIVWALLDVDPAALDEFGDVMR